MVFCFFFFKFSTNIPLYIYPACVNQLTVSLNSNGPVDLYGYLVIIDQLSVNLLGSWSLHV